MFKPVFHSAYLDIETTGLNPSCSEITVVGIYLEGLGGSKIVQLIDEGVTCNNLISVLRGVRRIYTYNGSRFDLPFIRKKLGLNLEDFLEHCDLMYLCWERKLYGGLKVVERKLKIERRLKDIDGKMAIILWEKYKRFKDFHSLKLLLEYNREDVCNLRILREKLEKSF